MSVSADGEIERKKRSGEKPTDLRRSHVMVNALAK